MSNIKKGIADEKDLKNKMKKTVKKEGVKSHFYHSERSKTSRTE